MFGWYGHLGLRLLQALAPRHGLAGRLPVHGADALDVSAGGGAANGAALAGRRQQERLAGVTVQGEVYQLGGAARVQPPAGAGARGAKYRGRRCHICSAGPKVSKKYSKKD